MANFLEAYKITREFEGGYSYHPNDFGRETFAGISRRFHPDWHGWAFIDDAKKHFISQGKDKSFFGSREFENYIYDKLKSLIRNFYKKDYWDKLRLDEVKFQCIANECFDNAVNMGVERASFFLQESCNLTNRDERDFKDIEVDGIVGSITLITVNNHKRPENLFNTINILQGMHYVNICRRNKEQRVFFNGWLSRVSTMKK